LVENGRMKKVVPLLLKPFSPFLPAFYLKKEKPSRKNTKLITPTNDRHTML